MTTTPQSTDRPLGIDDDRAGSRFGLWVVTAVLGLFLFAAGAPTPLYGIYASRWGFTPTMLTVIFAVYAVALLAAADGLGWLFVARTGQGMATGLATAAVAAALIDHQPSTRSGLGPLLNAVTPMIGLALGSLVAGALVQYAPHPLRLVFAAMLAGFVLLAAAMLRVPETVTTRRPVDLRPRIGVEPATRAMFWVTLPCIIACWALGGLYLSLGPSLIAQLDHSANHLLGGAAAFALCAAGAAAGLLLRRWAADRTMLLGCALLIGGLAVTVASIADSDGRLLFVGSVISGAGFGSTFLGAFRTLAAAASPARRGELIAALYVVAYLAFSLPAVAAGVLTTHLGLRDTTICYATVVAALAIGSLSAARIRTHPATA